MSLKADLFFSFRSPYSYLAVGRYRAMAEEYDLDITLRTVLPIAIRDPSILFTGNPNVGRYIVRDCMRAGEFLGIPIKWPRPDPVVQNLMTREIAEEQTHIYRLCRLGQAATRRGKGLAFAAEVAPVDTVLLSDVDVIAPCALGAVITPEVARRITARVVAGGANNQLARPENGAMLAERGILYAPDYVINAGGIISVTMEYLCRRESAPCDINEVRKRIALIPDRLKTIWQESEATGSSPDRVADAMAQKLIGRG